VPTTSRGYRYPLGSAAPNVPLDLANLASDVNGDVGALDATIEVLDGTSAWTNFTLAAGFQNYTGIAGYPPGYKITGNRVFIRGWIERTAAALFTFATNFTIVTAVPAAIRPATRPQLFWGMSQFSSTNAPLVRCEITTAGAFIVSTIGPGGGTAPNWVQFEGNYEKGM